MRMDEDSFFLSPPPYNIFSHMRQQELDYAFRLSSWEAGSPGWHTFVQRYLVSQGVRPTWLLNTCVNKSANEFSTRNCGPLYGFYNNWFATRVAFWRRPDVTMFLQHVDMSHTIYTKRWGDLLWQSAAVQIFMQPSRVRMLRSFAYEHATFGRSSGPRARHCMWYGGIALAEASDSQHAARERLAKVRI